MRRIRWSVVPGALVLVLGACGGGADSPEVASLDSPSPVPVESINADRDSASSVPVESNLAELDSPSSIPAETLPADLGHDDALLGFAQCMRDGGVDMPDPDPGSDRPDMPFGETFGATRDAFLSATETCSTFLTPSEQLPADHREELEANLLRFAKCMREHGIDMPDPTFNDNGGVEMQMGSEAGEIDEEAMEAANEACGEDGMFMAAPTQAGDGD